VLDRRIIRAVAPAAILTLALAACGSSKKETPSGGTSAAGGKVVKIGFIAPLSGSLSSLGLGMRNSAQLAIDQANAADKVKGFKIQLAAEDDTAKADVGGQVAARLASDPAVAGVIGTLNTSVALQVAPILQKESIAQVSPANTGVALTGRDNLAAQKRPFDNYFRVSTTDDIQGPFAANYISNDLKLTKVATVHDKKAYGQGLVASFSQQFKKNGGTVVFTDTINPGDTIFSTLLSKMKPTKPEIVYYGGEFPEMSLISSQAKPLGLKIPVMGGDGVYDQKYIDTAKQAAEGDLATSVGAPTEELASAKSFVSAYAAAGFKEPFSAYGGQAYDAANVIINALAKALDGKDSVNTDVRKAVIANIQTTDLDGVTGKVKFDDFGDTTTKLLTVYTVSGGKWVAKKSDSFK
jgi:branched-chain amino acid transport system substrate-binding protein